MIRISTLVGLCVLAGCCGCQSPHPTQAPRPLATVPVVAPNTSMVSPAPSAQAITIHEPPQIADATPITEATPAIRDLMPAPDPLVLEDRYRMRTSFIRTSNVVFDVTLNGEQIGSYNTDAKYDLNPIVRPGSNDVQVVWTSDPKMSENARAQIYIESQSPGSSEWNIVFSREISRDSKDQKGEASFTARTASRSSKDSITAD